MKILKKFFLILFLLILLIYVTNITSIPESILLFKGENLSLGNIFGIYIDEENDKTLEVGANQNDDNILEERKISLKLFNLIKVKEIEVSVIPKTTVIPLGESARFKTLYKWCTCCWND